MRPPARRLVLGCVLALGGFTLVAGGQDVGGRDPGVENRGAEDRGAEDWTERWLFDPRAERWLFNPQERTTRAIEAAERGELERAAELLETALRLAPQDPVAQYNAGTGRLAAGVGDAQTLLRAAAEQGTGDLVPRAHYNLGNARMSADDLPGAVEAFKQALRRDPDFADAKFNLELAQRLLERKQEEEQRQQEQQEQQQQEQQQDAGQQDQQGDPEQRQDQQQEQQDQQEGEDQQDGQDQDVEEPQERQSPLPQFRDLPDMTAEEAAAILEAVENMERERRRQEALEKAKANARGKKDW